MELRRAVAAAKARDHEVMYLLDRQLQRTEDSPAYWGGLLEPLAAGSGRVWADKSTRDLMMVIDVGAGTTDLSLFWVVQTGVHRAFPVVPCGDAIRMAGDRLDSLLVDELLNQAHIGADDRERQRLKDAIYLEGPRRLKERLFTTREVQHRLVDGQVVSMELSQFLNTSGVRNFAEALKTAVRDFLKLVDPSWGNAAGPILLVLTGGGSSLPMVKELLDETWTLGNRTVRFHPAAEIPRLISDRFDEDFLREYPQLAVALGGSLPVLDERTALREWMGGAPPPGPLERVQVTGI